MTSERGNYLANLALYPGRHWSSIMTCLRSNRNREQGLAQIQVLVFAFCALCTAAGTNVESNVHAGRVEFTSFLPENTQAAIIQPIGNDGVLIAASNTQRGFTRLDQVLSPQALQCIKPFSASILAC